MSWIKVTRSMEASKLKWVREALEAVGMRYRVSGEDFAHPWIEVSAEDQPRANRLLLPVDSLASDDPMFVASTGTVNPAWWDEAPRSFGELVGGIGILANRALRNMADEVGCRPEGASPYDCPLALGLIDKCPQDLWRACEPLTRVQALFLGISEVLDGNDNKALEWSHSLVREARSRRGGEEEMYWLTFFSVVGEWISEGTAHRLVAMNGQGASAVIDAVMKDTKEINGEIFPRVIKALAPKRAELN